MGRRVKTTGGELVGLAIPSATAYHRNVGYLGVLPGLRGRGYVDDILGEITRIHAAEGADRVTATTDVPNPPMAAAFDGANYQVKSGWSSRPRRADLPGGVAGRLARFVAMVEDGEMSYP